jgi:hypothetical protein
MVSQVKRTSVLEPVQSRQIQWEPKEIQRKVDQGRSIAKNGGDDKL